MDAMPHIVMSIRSRPSLLLLAALALACGSALAEDAAGAGKPPESKNERQLEGVTVTGKRDALSESDRRMKELQKSLPDLNSDAPKKEGLAQRTADHVVDYVKRRKDPNKLDDDSKTFLERSENPLDRPRADSVAPPLRPDARDYADPLCHDGSCPP